MCNAWKVVSVFNNLDETLDMTSEQQVKWSPLWRHVNDEFETKLEDDDDLSILQGKMFFVWDGNHRTTAWMHHITKCHPLEIEWHI